MAKDSAAEVMWVLGIIRQAGDGFSASIASHLGASIASHPLPACNDPL